MNKQIETAIGKVVALWETVTLSNAEYDKAQREMLEAQGRHLRAFEEFQSAQQALLSAVVPQEKCGEPAINLAGD